MVKHHYSSNLEEVQYLEDQDKLKTHNKRIKKKKVNKNNIKNNKNEH